MLQSQSALLTHQSTSVLQTGGIIIAGSENPCTDVTINVVSTKLSSSVDHPPEGEKARIDGAVTRIIRSSSLH